MDLMNQDNIVHVFFNTLGDIILANLCFVLCALPLVTFGPALTALYHCMLRTVKGNSNKVIKTYFRAFKENFLQSFAIWMGILAFAVILILNIRFLLHEGSGMGRLLFYCSGVLLAVIVIMFLYSFPVIAAFNGTVKDHLRNSVIFAFMHFPSTLAIAAISLLPMIMTYRDLNMMPLYACCWFFFGFGLTAYVNSLLLYKMFKPYLGEEEEEVMETI